MRAASTDPRRELPNGCWPAAYCGPRTDPQPAPCRQYVGRRLAIVGTIAQAVDGQNAATMEIARNVQQAAAGTNEVSSSIGGVLQAASETGSGASRLLSSSGELSKQAELLRSQVDRFLGSVRGAV